MFQLIYFILKLYQDLLKNNTRLFFLFYKSIKIKGPFPKPNWTENNRQKEKKKSQQILYVRHRSNTCKVQGLFFFFFLSLPHTTK